MSVRYISLSLSECSVFERINLLGVLRSLIGLLSFLVENTSIDGGNLSMVVLRRIYVEMGGRRLVSSPSWWRDKTQ
jgi:hypothetical protein